MERGTPHVLSQRSGSFSSIDSASADHRARALLEAYPKALEGRTLHEAAEGDWGSCAVEQILAARPEVVPGCVTAADIG